VFVFLASFHIEPELFKVPFGRLRIFSYHESCMWHLFRSRKFAQVNSGNRRTLLKSVFSYRSFDKYVFRRINPSLPFQFAIS